MTIKLVASNGKIVGEKPVGQTGYLSGRKLREKLATIGTVQGREEAILENLKKIGF